jgi:hypothetical protein
MLKLKSGRAAKDWCIIEASGEERLMRIVLAALSAWVALFPVAQAQPPCGEAPPVADLTLKRDLEAKAKALASIIGNTQLKGQTEVARTDIFSRYPKADRTRSDNYLEYWFCSIVLANPNLSTQEKVRALLEFREAFSELRPPPDVHQQSSGSSSPAIIGGGNVTIQALPGNPTTPMPGPIRQR